MSKIASPADTARPDRVLYTRNTRRRRRSLVVWLFVRLKIKKRVKNVANIIYFHDKISRSRVKRRFLRRGGIVYRFGPFARVLRVKHRDRPTDRGARPRNSINFFFFPRFVFAKQRYYADNLITRIWISQ